MIAPNRFPGYYMQRSLAVDAFVVAILHRLPVREYHRAEPEVNWEDGEYQEILQEAISGVLAGLEDHLQADLYTRIVTALEARQGTLAQIITNEVRATNLWSAI